METLEAIRQRRAVKHYDPAHKFTDDELTSLLELALLAPTSFNIQNWRPVVITDNTELRQQIRAAAWDQAQVTDASVLFILCADLKSWDKEPERYWANAPEAARDVLVPMIKPFYDGKDQLQRDEALRSVGIQAQTIMLAAKGMGYDSCPMIGFDQDAVAKLINLPGDHIIGMMVTVGKATKPAWPRPGQLPLSEVVIRDTF